MAFKQEGRRGSQQRAAFTQRKKTFLSKSDKSSAGGIDLHAREVCAVINERTDVFTTSSCSGRAYLWSGEGVKSTANFDRYRVTHELINDPEVYFDLGTLPAETVDGSWDGPSRTREKPAAAPVVGDRRVASWLARVAESACKPFGLAAAAAQGGPTRAVWLRFEPFILHVCCRDFSAASSVVAAARQVFKNVGVQSWAEGKVTMAMWGDEGLEMPLTGGDGRPLFVGQASWLQGQVNDRHRRNWAKIDRFTQALRELASAEKEGVGATTGGPAADDECDEDPGSECSSVGGGDGQRRSRVGPRHFDVVGDVAVLSSAPAPEDCEKVAQEVLRGNGKIRVVAARRGPLEGDHRAPGSEGLHIIGGQQRKPLMTTHCEFGVRYMLNLDAAFFSPRMGPERQRLCAQSEGPEDVLVAFAGCCPEAMQFAALSSTRRVVAIELNLEAVKCAGRSRDKLPPARGAVLELVHGDVCQVCPTMKPGSFDRLVAPRPKGATQEEDDALVDRFLESLLPLLREGGTCHWYDFVADWELPECRRSVARIEAGCAKAGRACDVRRSAPANGKPVAERQYRTVIDFVVR